MPDGSNEKALEAEIGSLDLIDQKLMFALDRLIENDVLDQRAVDMIKGAVETRQDPEFTKRLIQEATRSFDGRTGVLPLIDSIISGKPATVSAPVVKAAPAAAPTCPSLRPKGPASALQE